MGLQIRISLGFFYVCAARKGKRIAMAGKLKDDDKLDFETSEDVEIVPSFDTMGLKDELLRGIYAYGAALQTIRQAHCVRPTDC